MTGRLLAVATAAVAVLYGRAWRFDLQCDDLAMIRPWSRAELAGVWHGTWDPQHAFAVFFRPLAAWFFAGSFELFGVRAPAHLVLSLVLLTLVIFALALFVARESGSVPLGALTAVIYAAHPNTPWSTGVWVMNDVHKLAALTTLSALLIWQRARRRSWSAWWPIALLITTGFLIKEDTLMLIPALLAAQWARSRFVRDVAPPPRAAWLAAGAFGLALAGWRWSALHEIGGFGWPSSFEMAARNLLRGPYYALAGQGAAPAGFSLPALAAGAIALAVIGITIARLPRHRQWPAIVAVILMACFDAPLVLISNMTRYYIVTMAGAIVLAVVTAGLWSAARAPIRRAALAAVFGVLLVVTGARQQAILDDFALCGRLTGACRSWTLEAIPQLPPEARAYVVNLPATCSAAAPHRLDDSAVLTWGLSGGSVVDTMTGHRAREAAAHIVTLVRASARSATLTVRHPLASMAAPVDVAITADDGDASRLRLTSDQWVETTIALPTGWRAWLRGMHRADVRVSAAGAPRAGLEWQAPTLRH